MTEVDAWVKGYRLPLLALVAVLLAAAVCVLAGARTGALSLATILALAAVLRAVVRAPGRGIAIRSRGFDVALLGGLAVVIAGLASTTAGV
jgi:hypothetical protein